MIKIILCSIVMFSLSCTHAPAPGSASGSASSVSAETKACIDFDAQWAACEKTEECTAAYDACGMKTAYNSDFLGKIEEYNRCQVTAMNCGSPESDPNREVNVTRCKDKKCELVKNF